MAIRKAPDWMTQTDERILEFLNSERKSTPMEMAESGYVTKDNKYINQRLKVLLGSGLVNRSARGVYIISSKGEEFLAGIEDLRDEDEPN